MLHAASDPTDPYINNQLARRIDLQLADLTNPNIKPWAKQIMKRENERVLVRGRVYAARELYAGLHAVSRRQTDLIRREDDGDCRRQCRYITSGLGQVKARAS
jgi:hypothetical protein